jgi:protease PrsW
MNYFFLLFFALLPSIVWLLYYLKKDIHPEPKRVIFYVFLAGAFFALIGYFFQKTASPLFFSFAKEIFLPISVIIFFYRFIIVAFSEELLKYFAFSFTAKKHTGIDEPMDFIIYMITAGLGFAALENIIIFLSLDINVLEMALTSVIRFVSGTLLHATVSGIMGVFLIYACRLNRKSFIPLGLFFVTFLHGIYNILAEKIEEWSLIYFLLFFILFFFLLISLLFLFIKKAKKMKSVSFFQ